MGPRTNLGAGLVTCNFDGVAKNRTSIGSDCFVGSSSTLVAPVSVGNGALIAAGSVVTKVCCAAKLVLSKSQVTGWAVVFAWQVMNCMVSSEAVRSREIC